MRPPRPRPLAALLVLVATSLVLAGPASAAPAAGQQSNTTDNGTGDATTEPTDAAENASVTNVTVWSGDPAVAAALDDRAAVERAIATGRLTRSPRLLENDTLVLELHAPGIDRRMAAADGRNATARFFAATHGPNSTLVLEQANPTTMRAAKAGPLNQTDAVRVLPDAANDTYYLVIDLHAMWFDRDWADERVYDPDHEDVDRVPVTAGEAFGLVARLDGTERYFQPGDFPPDELFRVPHTFVSYRFEGRREPLELLPAERGRLVATGDLPPNETVRFRITDRSDGGPETVLTTTTTADTDPTNDEWDANATGTLDLTGFAHGSSFEIRVEARNTTLDRVTASIRFASDRIALADRSTWTDGIRLRHLWLPSDATLVVVDGGWSGIDRVGTVAGTRRLAAGYYRNVTIPVPSDPLVGYVAGDAVSVVALRDVDGDGQYDRVVRANGSAIGVSSPATSDARPGFRGPAALTTTTPTSPSGSPSTEAAQTTPAPTTTTRSTTTAPATTASRRSTTASVEPGPTTTTGPGFGVASVLGVLLVLGATARRRH